MFVCPTFGQTSQSEREGPLLSFISAVGVTTQPNKMNMTINKMKMNEGSQNRVDEYRCWMQNSMILILAMVHGVSKIELLKIVGENGRRR